MKKSNSQKSGLQKKEWLAGYLFILPNFIGFLIFIALPVLVGFFISFTDYNGFNQCNFVGLSNYTKMFQDTFFQTALWNNIIFTITSVPLTLLVALLLALALNKKIFMGEFFKTVYFFPTITSMVAVGIVWSMIFNPSKGPVNQFLMGIGIENVPKWLASSSTAMMTIVFVTVWKNAGYYMIMFLGGLKSIPEQLYEAAQIDGANAWERFWHVTWPMLSPTTFMVTILCVISSFQVFDIINIMTEGGPGRSTNVLVYRIYQEGFENLRFGYASAMAYFLFLIIIVITVIQFKGQKKWVNE